MAAASLNLATRSPEDRAALDADRAACFLKYHKTKMGKEWRAWAESKLKEMSNEAAVRAALNLRLGGGK